MTGPNLSEMSEKQPWIPHLNTEIRMRAYDIYEQHGRREGSALRDWLQAQAEILHTVSPPEGLHN